ncbi:hypothetical protein C8R44DRAFT_989714 [Mycena epipterygia]|nr:hypothetical protein C8R44DRAFT_989714 [Mycena epipterygia]
MVAASPSDSDASRFAVARDSRSRSQLPPAPFAPVRLYRTGSGRPQDLLSGLSHSPPDSAHRILRSTRTPLPARPAPSRALFATRLVTVGRRDSCPSPGTTTYRQSPAASASTAWSSIAGAPSCNGTMSKQRVMCRTRSYVRAFAASGAFAAPGATRTACAPAVACSVHWHRAGHTQGAHVRVLVQRCMAAADSIRAGFESGPRMRKRHPRRAGQPWPHPLQFESSSRASRFYRSNAKCDSLPWTLTCFSARVVYNTTS